MTDTTEAGAGVRAGTTAQREQYIAGLRALADALEAHPELALPYTGTGAAVNVIPSYDQQREQLVAWARVLPGRRDKHDRDGYLDLDGAFHGLKICNRAAVCERVVVGTREVVEDVPDPDALAAVPTVQVTKTVEDVEWRCAPILDAGQAPAGAR